MTALTHTFSYKGARFTVRQRNGWDFTDSIALFRKLSEGGIRTTNDIESNRATFFVQAVLQTIQVDGTPPLVWTGATATAGEIVAAFHAFGEESGLQAQFFHALNAVEKLSIEAEEDDPNVMPPTVVSESA